MHFTLLELLVALIVSRASSHIRGHTRRCVPSASYGTKRAALNGILRYFQVARIYAPFLRVPEVPRDYTSRSTLVVTTGSCYMPFERQQ